MIYNKNDDISIENAYDKWINKDYEEMNESEEFEMKIVYNVEVKGHDYNDDTFNGTFEECLDYIHECEYPKEDVRIAKILLDENDLVLEVKEIIIDWD